jgi:hypothetical protein
VTRFDDDHQCPGCPQPLLSSTCLCSPKDCSTPAVLDQLLHKAAAHIIQPFKCSCACCEMLILAVCWWVNVGKHLAPRQHSTPCTHTLQACAHGTPVHFASLCRLCVLDTPRCLSHPGITHCIHPHPHHYDTMTQKLAATQLHNLYTPPNIREHITTKTPPPHTIWGTARTPVQNPDGPSLICVCAAFATSGNLGVWPTADAPCTYKQQQAATQEGCQSRADAGVQVHHSSLSGWHASCRTSGLLLHASTAPMSYVLSEAVS